MSKQFKVYAMGLITPLKTIRTKNGVIHFFCIICIDEHDSHLSRKFNSLSTLKMHTEQCHKSHPSYKSIKRLLKNIEIAVNIGIVG